MSHTTAKPCPDLASEFQHTYTGQISPDSQIPREPREWEISTSAVSGSDVSEFPRTTIGFLLSPRRDAVAAKHFLQMAMWRVGGTRPRVINVDGHAAYPQAIRELKASGELRRQCRCRPTPCLNNVLEQDHRFVKKRLAASLWFRSIEGASRTIAGYKAMNVIRKGQIRWLAKGDVLGQVHYIERIFGVAA